MIGPGDGKNQPDERIGVGASIDSVTVSVKIRIGSAGPILPIFFFIPLYSSSLLLLLGFVLLVSVSVRADRGAGNVPRSHPP